MDEINSTFEKLRVLFKFIKGNRVVFGVLEHSNVQISVRQPIDSVSEVVDSAENNFGIELVRK